MRGIKNIFIVLLVAISFLSAYSQGFTFRWTGGYAWQPGNTSNIPAPEINTKTPDVDRLVNMAYTSDTGNGTNVVVHNSYGHGFNVGAKFGYQFNPYVSIDIGATYAISANISCTQLHTLYLPDSTGVISSSGGFLNATILTRAQSVTLSPSVTLSYAKPKSKFWPYLRVGLVLPVWTSVKHFTSMNLIGVSASSTTFNAPYFLGNQTYDTLKTKPTFSLGVTGAIGVVYRVHSFLQLFAEVNFQYLNLKAKSANYTGWTADGTNLQAIRDSTGRNVISHVPTLPFSNIGFNIGVQLLLNKKIFTDRDNFEETRKRKAKAKKKAESSN